MLLPKSRRFDGEAAVAVKCSECSRKNSTIIRNSPFVIIVKWDDVWVNTQTGTEYVNNYEGELDVKVELAYDPAPRITVSATLNRTAACIIHEEPDAWELKTPAKVTLHHLDGCGVVTNSHYKYRMPGSAGSRQ